MRAAQVIPVTLLLAFAANAQVFKAGRCPTPAVQANFDASRVRLRPHADAGQNRVLSGCVAFARPKK